MFKLCFYNNKDLPFKIYCFRYDKDFIKFEYELELLLLKYGLEVYKDECKRY